MNNPNSLNDSLVAEFSELVQKNPPTSFEEIKEIHKKIYDATRQAFWDGIKKAKEQPEEKNLQD